MPMTADTYDIDKELQQEYDRFIEFGTLLNKQMRRYLVQYIRHEVSGEADLPPNLNDQYFM